eukprot:Skav234717  [mRNA]  locus=scaffold634:149620:157870:+ [translate_table: standard]
MQVLSGRGCSIASSVGNQHDSYVKSVSGMPSVPKQSAEVLVARCCQLAPRKQLIDLQLLSQVMGVVEDLYLAMWPLAQVQSRRAVGFCLMTMTLAHRRGGLLCLALAATLLHWRSQEPNFALPEVATHQVSSSSRAASVLTDGRMDAPQMESLTAMNSKYVRKPYYEDGWRIGGKNMWIEERLGGNWMNITALKEYTFASGRLKPRAPWRTHYCGAQLELQAASNCDGIGFAIDRNRLPCCYLHVLGTSCGLSYICFLLR